MIIWQCPEPSLDPPEPVIIGYCPVCGKEIYEGDPVWKKGGDMICEDHMDLELANWTGWERMDFVE